MIVLPNEGNELLCLVCSQNGGMIVVPNEGNEFVPMRPLTGWQVCIDYRKLNTRIKKHHFPMPIMAQMLDRLVGK